MRRSLTVYERGGGWALVRHARAPLQGSDNGGMDISPGLSPWAVIGRHFVALMRDAREAEAGTARPTGLVRVMRSRAELAWVGVAVVGVMAAQLALGGLFGHETLDYVAAWPWHRGREVRGDDWGRCSWGGLRPWGPDRFSHGGARLRRAWPWHPLLAVGWCGNARWMGDPYAEMDLRASVVRPAGGRWLLGCPVPGNEFPGYQRSPSGREEICWGAPLTRE